MSRIGKQPITIPKGVEATFVDGTFSVKGPKGSLSRAVSPMVAVAIADGVATVSMVKNTDAARPHWGTTAAHVANMVEGVTQGFEKKLEIEGVGFRAEVKGKNLALAIGFSHPVEVPIPDGVTVTVEKSLITITGHDKEVIGQFAAVVRDMKRPEPYKGKGIRYSGEYIIRKQGKKAV